MAIFPMRIVIAAANAAAGSLPACCGSGVAEGELFGSSAVVAAEALCKPAMARPSTNETMPDFSYSFVRRYRDDRLIAPNVDAIRNRYLSIAFERRPLEHLSRSPCQPRTMISTR